jgi:large subunit ribosomal protein L5
MIARLHQRYREEIVPKLREEFSYANPHQIPSVSKVVINGRALLRHLGVPFRQ